MRLLTSQLDLGSWSLSCSMVAWKEADRLANLRGAEEEEEAHSWKEQAAVVEDVWHLIPLLGLYLNA